MPIYVGTAGRVNDDTAVIANIKNWSLDTGAGDLDASNFGSTWRLNDSGIKEWSGSFEGNYDDTDAQQTTMWTKLSNGADVMLYFYMDFVSGSYSFSGNAKLTGVSPSQAYDGLGGVSYQFKGNGPLTQT